MPNRLIPFLILLAILIAACAPDPVARGEPRLLEEVAVDPTEVQPTRELSPTPLFADATPLPPSPTFVSERQSPLQEVTVDADFVLVTPTLPPSKTPTATPSNTTTPTVSPTPTLTVTATATAPVFPTSIVIPVTSVVVQPLPEVCDSLWLYLNPPPAGCPTTPPLASQGVYQTFQNGEMIWIGQRDQIFVMYTDGTWEFYPDNFNEGDPESDPAYATAPSANLWQPRRGFGLIWRNSQPLRQRIGWATIQWEQAYSNLTYQQGVDGTLLVTDPIGRVFHLRPDRTWAVYAGFGF